MTTVLEHKKKQVEEVYTQKLIKKRGEYGRRDKLNKKYLSSFNVLVTVFFNLHTQLGTRRFSSGRLFNCVASRKATNTHTHTSHCIVTVQSL